jgi:hypothetical protein
VNRRYPALVRRFLAVAVLAAATVALAPPPAAHACSCVARRDLARDVRSADAAFVGVMTSRDVLPGSQPIGGGGVMAGNGTAVSHFRVERSVKGGLQGQVDVRSPESGSACGLEVQPGGRIGLLLQRGDGGWVSGLCQQTSAADLVAATRPGSGHLTWDVVAVLLLGLVAAVAARLVTVHRHE